MVWTGKNARKRAQMGERWRRSWCVFHWDLGIKYLHDSSFASVYTAKLANPKYSAFTSTHRRETGAGDGRARGSVRVTGLWLYANTARGLICRLRTFGADSKIAIHVIILGVRRVKIALNQRPLKPVRARPLLLRVKSSERLSFVKSRLQVPNWPPRMIVVRMKSTHELEEAWRLESTIQFPLAKNN